MLKKIPGLFIVFILLSIYLQSNAHPFPLLEKGYRDKTFIAALDYIPFEEELNKEMIKVVGLTGKYTLLIDGIEVGRYDAPALSEGVNLAFNKATPQYKQAEKVLKLQEEKVEKEHIQRDIAWIYHGLLAAKGLDRNSSECDVINAVIDAKLNYNEYQRNQADKFLENFKRENQLFEEVKNMQKEIYTINKPVEHHYVLQKIQQGF